MAGLIVLLLATAATLSSALVYDGYSSQSASNPCTIGPNEWCQSSQQQEVCQVNEGVVGVCGYSSGKCPTQSISAFCSNATTLAPNKTQLTYDGGLSGLPPGLFSYYILSLYWPASNCLPNQITNDSFCSQYTLAGNEASNHLVAHGLWPDFGSVYAANPTAPLYNGSYEGWPQYCNGPEVDGYECHVNGGLCPYANATSPSFTQSAYDNCMVYANVSQCTLEPDVFDALGTQFQRYAPGYYSQPTSFINHEFYKHGSCVGGYLSSNATAFFEQVVDAAANNTAPGTPAYTMIHNNRGHSVSRTALEAAFYPTAVPMCQKDCDLDSVSFCIGRDEAGFPTQLQNCTVGTLGSANCASYNCTQVNIPAYPGQAASPSGQPAAAPAVSGGPAKAPTPGAGAPTNLLGGFTPPRGAPISGPVAAVAG